MTTVELVITIVGSILGAAGLWKFIEFLITRRDNKKDKLNDLSKQVAEGFKQTNDSLTALQENDKRTDEALTRVQLLQMIDMRPTDVIGISKIAERYFKDLRGDWYATHVFADWLAKGGYDIPEWFSWPEDMKRPQKKQKGERKDAE